jgi:hypothetical protein
MSSLYSQDLMKSLLRSTNSRNYSVASKNRGKLSAIRHKAQTASETLDATLGTSYTASAPTLPRPRPPPPSPPPSWRFPFESAAKSTGHDAQKLESGLKLNQLGESQSHYDLSKQASWSDPPLVARARSKTVKQRNVWESYLSEWPTRGA